MADKKKVLGKGKSKNKDYPYVKKLKLPKYSSESLPSDEYNFKKNKSSSPEPRKKNTAATPSGFRKQRFFNKRISEPPKFHKDDFESKRKSMPNIQDGNEANDAYIKGLSCKLAKYKHRNFEMEEEIKQMESRYKHEEFGLRDEINKLTGELKKLKNDYSDKEIIMHREMLTLRSGNEEIKLAYKHSIDQIRDIIENTSENFIKENLNMLLAEICLKFEDDIVKNSVGEILFLPSNFTASFNNISTEVQSSRELMKMPHSQAIVLHNYNSICHGELNLKSGDRVTILNFDENSGW